MTKYQQITFITDLAHNVTNEMLKDIDTKGIPEEWDGIELRWWIADRFSQVVIWNTGSKKRRREYDNHVLVNNLI